MMRKKTPNTKWLKIQEGKWSSEMISLIFKHFLFKNTTHNQPYQMALKNMLVCSLYVPFVGNLVI